MSARRKTTNTFGSPPIARRISRRRGFTVVKVRDRGPIGRGLARGYQAARKLSWYDTAIYFHAHLRERRFDPAHQRAAGFALRKGQGMASGTKQYRRSYTGIKERRFGHTRALEFSGATRRAMRTASISSTGNKGKAAYRGASKFSFRHPKSRVRMNEEFPRLLPAEVTELAKVYDESLDTHWQ